MADTAIKQVGVELVAKNEAGFSRSIQNTNALISQLSPSMGKLTSAFFAGNIAFAAVSMALGGVQSAIQGVTSAITGMVNKAIEIQQVSLGLESLAAREQLAAGKAEDMNEALAQAIPITKDLLKQIRALDEVSPFSFEDVLAAFRTNMAFGQTMETSVGLTKAILDVAAASGQGAYVIQRLAYNFSQMTLTGQITMRDFRDLSMAGFDLARMLREELGMSIQEVNAALKTGEVTMQQVSQAFMDYAEKNFGGAAKRMAETIPGVMSSFQGLFAVVSNEVFGESVSNLGKAFKDVYDFASQIVNSGIFQIFGAVLDVLTTKVADITGAIPDLNDSMLEDIADSMMAFVESMFDFGLGMMEAFAEGIIAGGSVIIDAVLGITSLIGDLLMPHSPPKALPNIDKWGAGAMLEYLKGFTEADFDVLKGVQNKIKSALSILGTDKTGKIYQTLSTGLARALSTGQMDTGFLSKLSSQLGPYGAEVSKLVDLEFRLATAMEAVDKARRTESVAMTKLQQLVMDYNRAVKEGADPQTLKAKMELVDAQQLETSAAIDARVEAEKGLDQIALLEEQVKLQRDLVDAILDMGRAMQQAKALAGAGGGAGGGFGIPETGGVDVSGAITAWEQKIEEFKTRLNAKIDETFTAIKTQWDNSALGKFITKMSEVFNPKNTNIEQIQAFYDAVFGKELDATAAGKIATILEGYGKAIDGIDVKKILEITVKSSVMAKFLKPFILFMASNPALVAVATIGYLGNAIRLLADSIKVYKETGKFELKLPALPEFVFDFSKAKESASTEINSFVANLPEPDWSMYAIAPPEESLASVMGFFDTTKTITDTAMNGEGGMVPVTNAATETILTAMNTTYQTIATEVTTKTTEAATANKTNMETIQKDTEDNLTKVETKAKSATDIIKKGFNDTTVAVDNLTLALKAWAKEVLSGQTSVALAKLMDIIGHQSLPPLAIGANDISAAVANLATKALPKLETAVNGITRPYAPAYAGNTTYNVSIPVTASISNDQDVHKLAYVIAREFNQRMNR